MSSFFLGAIVLFAIWTVVKGVRIVPQARAAIVERFGKFHRQLNPGLTIVVPFIDRVLPLVDIREQVVSFPPSGVITEDNVTVNIDTVLYFTITDPKSVTYEVADPLSAIEQLTATTLRNAIGGLTLEQALTSRDQINSQLRTVLDDATGRWGIRVSRVELKAIDPPSSIQEAMEKQMRAERDRRASVLTAQGEREASIARAEGAKQASILEAEGHKQSVILTAEAEQQAAVLRAEGERQATVLAAIGEAEANEAVFRSLHDGELDEHVLSYLYLQMLPQLAQGDANKMWIVPSELTAQLAQMRDSLLKGSAPSPATRSSASPKTQESRSMAPRAVSSRPPGSSTPSPVRPLTSVSPPPRPDIDLDA